MKASSKFSVLLTGVCPSLSVYFQSVTESFFFHHLPMCCLICDLERAAMLRMLGEGRNCRIAVTGSFPVTVLISDGEDGGFLLPC